MKHYSVFSFFLFVFSFSFFSLSAQNQFFEGVDVFKNNTDGYSCFRIPAVTLTKKGTVLAFAEGRKNGCSDTGNIDLVLRRSTDGGKTWGDLITVWDDGENVCGNPAPVVDKKTGRIFLICCWNLGEDHEYMIYDQKSKDTRRVYSIYSDDDGRTWSKPQDITPTVKRTDWTWYATGPCHGIQLQNKKYKNRLVVSANHVTAGTKAFHSQVIYSDDAGKTWQLGGVITEPGGNESSIVELENGNLMLNMRNYNRKAGICRSFAISTDGGVTFGAVQYAPELIEPVCQGSIINYTRKGKLTSCLLFSNPASANKREGLTIKMSNDSGKSWPLSYVVFPGPAAYSDLVILPTRKIGILYEYGNDNPYQNIRFQSVTPNLFKP